MRRGRTGPWCSRRDHGRGLAAHLRALTPRPEAALEDLTASHALVSVQGPFAWEIAGAIAGPDVFAAPFYTSFHLEELAGIGVRTGKVGEYAYDFLVPRTDEAALREIFTYYATSHGLVAIDRTTLARAALEHGSFSVDLPGAAALTPLELQLQWRLDYTREVPGMPALRVLRADAQTGRITWFFAPGDGPGPETGQPLEIGGQIAGTVVDAFYSAALAGVVGTALLSRDLAHLGLAALWQPPRRSQLVRTVGPRASTTAAPSFIRCSTATLNVRTSNIRRSRGSSEPSSRVLRVAGTARATRRRPAIQVGAGS
ncbi:hypothetical protein [Nannocystis sp.]|uniref:hypothetical protein n=1 Tax=Nannocystis sp. TaxID=1962667 RepID=UPI0025CFDAA8|nr:hypothetical protein [Nannocystis sp.]MBK7823682.1 aminomethyl transferase family protein [Nannocystis sp.]